MSHRGACTSCRVCPAAPSTVRLTPFSTGVKGECPRCILCRTLQKEENLLFSHGKIPTLNTALFKALCEYRREYDICQSNIGGNEYYLYQQKYLSSAHELAEEVYFEIRDMVRTLQTSARTATVRFFSPEKQLIIELKNNKTCLSILSLNGSFELIRAHLR